MSDTADKGLFRKGVKRSLKNRLSNEEYAFVVNALRASNRILPHTETEEWKKIGGSSTSTATWTTIDEEQRRGIRLSIYVPQMKICLETTLTRRVPGKGVRNVRRVPDKTEMGICQKIVECTSQALKMIATRNGGNAVVPADTIDELRRSFDDRMIVDFLKEANDLLFDLGDLIEFLRVLSEQSYENKSLSFGVLVKQSGRPSSKHKRVFPLDFESEKRFKAFTDGYRSAYLLDSAGHALKLVDLEILSARKVRGEHYFPEWSRNIALSSRKGTIGFSLTRQGDILYFQDGSLRFTRRAGKWQYWNHAYIIDILQNKARAQRVDRKKLGKVVAALYRYALDVSFRRSGGLFVILRKAKSLHRIVRSGDAMGDSVRSDLHRDFERFLMNRTIVGLDRNVVLDLSAIDGAMVLSNMDESGPMEPYSNPRRSPTCAR